MDKISATYYTFLLFFFFFFDNYALAISYLYVPVSTKRLTTKKNLIIYSYYNLNVDGYIIFDWTVNKKSFLRILNITRNVILRLITW